MHMLSYDVITCLLLCQVIVLWVKFRLRIYTTHSCVVGQSTFYQDLAKTISRASAL